LRKVLELFQTAGAIVAFVAGAFTLYDYLFRYRPYVSIFAELSGADVRPMLRVTNVAPFDIFIENIEIAPPLFGVSQQTTARPPVAAVSDTQVTAVVESGGTAEFLIDLGKAKSEPRRDQAITVKVHWYRSQPSVIRPLATAVRTSIRDIEERTRAVERTAPGKA
jgi:hypothetical protein